MKKSRLAEVIKKMALKEIRAMMNEQEQYMFIQNLDQIKNHVEQMANIPKEELTATLNEHPWAVDHIATSKESIDQVYHFLMSGDKDKKLGETPPLKEGAMGNIDILADEYVEKIQSAIQQEIGILSSADKKLFKKILIKFAIEVTKLTSAYRK